MDSRILNFYNFLRNTADSKDNYLWHNLSKFTRNKKR